MLPSKQIEVASFQNLSKALILSRNKGNSAVLYSAGIGGITDR